VDYLLKPVSRARLAAAIARVRTLGAAAIDANVDQIVRRPHMAPARFLGRRGARLTVVPQKDIVYFGSDSGLTKLYTIVQQYVMDATLNDFEHRVDPGAFCRVSRTVLVNLEYVAAVQI